jgi:hypothetical protein
MTVALHHWNRETLLARLRAGDAIDRAAETDPTGAARERLRLLGIGDRFEARVLSEAETVAAFEDVRVAAERLTHRALVDD